MTGAVTDGVATGTVLYYCVATHLGGAERSLLELVTRIEARSDGRYRPFLLLPAGTGPLVDAADREGIPRAVLPMPPGFFAMSRARPVRSLLQGALAWPAVRGYLRRVQALVAAERPRLIHTTGIKCHLLAAGLGRSTPVLWHLRDVVGGATRSLLRRLRGRPGVHVIANSAATARAFDSGEGAPEVIHNGIDVEAFAAAVEPPHRQRFREGFGAGAAVPVVGIVGVIAAGKGIDRFLEMAARLRAQGVDARYVVVGDAIYDTGRDRGLRRELEVRVEELGLAGVVTFAGYDPDPVRVMAGLDVLVSASTEPESFGRVVVEAMAAGVAVAGSDLGGVAEIIVDGESGRLFPPGDVDAMARAVGGILADAELRQRLVEGGRARARERFGVDSHVAGIIRTYDRILAG